jgi:hypothetical protein
MKSSGRSQCTLGCRKIRRSRQVPLPPPPSSSTRVPNTSNWPAAGGRLRARLRPVKPPGVPAPAPARLSLTAARDSAADGRRTAPRKSAARQTAWTIVGGASLAVTNGLLYDILSSTSEKEEK